MKNEKENLTAIINNVVKRYGTFRPLDEKLNGIYLKETDHHMEIIEECQTDNVLLRVVDKHTFEEDVELKSYNDLPIEIIRKLHKSAVTYM